jgi:hypothetical protein
MLRGEPVKCAAKWQRHLNGPKTVSLITNERFLLLPLAARPAKSTCAGSTPVTTPHKSAACRILPAILSAATNETRKCGDFMSVAAGASDDAVKAERTV